MRCLARRGGPGEKQRDAFRDAQTGKDRKHTGRNENDLLTSAAASSSREAAYSKGGFSPRTAAVNTVFI